MGTVYRGENKKLYIDDASGFPSPVAISGIKEITVNRSNTRLDATDAESGAATENLPGRRTTTYDITFGKEVGTGGAGDDAGQEELMTAFYARTGAYFRFHSNGDAAGLPREQFFAHIYDPNESNPNDGLVGFTLTLQASGAVNTADQT